MLKQQHLAKCYSKNHKPRPLSVNGLVAQRVWDCCDGGTEPSCVICVLGMVVRLVVSKEVRGYQIM